MNLARRTDLPDGRTLVLDDGVAGRLCCGVAVLSGVVVDDSTCASETSALGAELRERYAGLQPAQIPVLDPARALYKSFGMDPSRHRPSSEALLRRILKGGGLYRINCAVDACNLASLRFMLPIGMYDLAKVRGDIVLRTGRPGESYRGIRKGQVNLGGRLGLFDSVGPFGSPTSDSARTSVDEGTSEILAVILADNRFGSRPMAENVTEFGGIFGRFCGAEQTLGVVLGAGES